MLVSFPRVHPLRRDDVRRSWLLARLESVGVAQAAAFALHRLMPHLSLRGRRSLSVQSWFTKLAGRARRKLVGWLPGRTLRSKRSVDVPLLHH